MVDESQDTNRLQCDLIDLIAGDELFFVGDEFQSIYGFRHADVNVFRERREEAGSVLPLTLNYRSRPEVLAAVNHLFGSDFGEESQPLAASGDFPDPVFGTPVELLVTDKASYSGTGTHWRRGEARSVARRVKELVETGAAKPGEIVLLFAAGTDAEWYEQELRELGLPTYRTTGRGYFGQQQVADLLAYLRLLHNRYDDEALVPVLASPLIGVSNDALVLLRRTASKRPLFKGLERVLPEGLDPRDERLFQAFRQRFERLGAASRTLSLERLCEEIVAPPDYDPAVLAQWDGRRRYAKLRKLPRPPRPDRALRGVDRLIVAGWSDPEKAAEGGPPIGWVRGRLETPGFGDAGAGPVELEREGARILLRLAGLVAERAVEPVPEPAAEPGQLALFEP